MSVEGGAFVKPVITLILAVIMALLINMICPVTAAASDDADAPFACIKDDGRRYGFETGAARLEEAALSTGWCIGICTDFPLDQGEFRYYEAFGERDGVILCINMGFAKVIAVGSAADYVNGVRAENIERLTERELKHGRNANIPRILADRLEGLRQKGPGSFDLYPPAFAVSVAAAFAAGFGTVLWISRRYGQNDLPIVNNYLDVRSIDIYRRNDEQIFAKSVRYKNNVIQQMVRGEGIFRRR